MVCSRVFLTKNFGYYFFYSQLARASDVGELHAAQLHCNRWLIATNDRIITMQRIAEATWNVPSWSQNILRIVQWEQDCQQRSRQQNVTGSNKWGYMTTRSKWASVSCTYASGHQEGRSSGAGEEPARMFLAVLQTWRKSRVPICPYVPGTVPVLWVLSSCVPVTLKISFRDANCPVFLAPSHESMIFWQGVRTF